MLYLYYLSMAKAKTKTALKTISPRRVVVALRMAGIAGQDKLNGIFEHLSAGYRWQLIIYRTKHEFTAKTVENEIARGADGFIVGIPGADDALAAIASADIPAVMLNVTSADIEKKKKKIAFVKSDSDAVGKAAANTLLKQGVYKSYGFVGYRTDEDWSRERGAAFSDALASAGFKTKMFDIAHFKEKIEDKCALSKWLKSLPKPCGILSACDDRAFEIIDVCRENGFAIPSEIGILGVNNDPILCENAEVRLSSIQPDFIGEGRLAAELLARMMDGAALSAEKRVYKLGVKTVVHRGSTVAQSESGRLVQNVLAYISKEALRGISVEDVARRFKVSRSLLELRFSELQHESVYNAMLRIRLDEVKRRLRDTDDPISEITHDCGWKNPAPPKTLFKKRFGISMRDYRRS